MSATTPPEAAEPEQVRVRLAKRARMLEQGLDPYPVLVPHTATIAEVRHRYDGAGLASDTGTGDEVAVAGRVIFLRDTGKLCFVRLRGDGGSELQCMLSQADLGEKSLADFKSFVDIGDQLAVQGEVVTSRRGELSVQARDWQLAAKALRPLPVEHKQLSEETRARLRYVDLIVRSGARDMVRMRAQTLSAVRSTLADRGFLEVETPTLQHVQGGAAARPFRTHLNVFDLEMTLRIALELHLKRCIVGGLERVYEVGRIFRNEGVDSTHSPEFTMLEAYEAYGDYNTMKDLTRDLVVHTARLLGRTVVHGSDGSEIDLEGEWRTLPLLEAVSAAVGEQLSVDCDERTLRKIGGRAGLELDPRMTSGQILVELYEQLVERNVQQPTFISDYPASVKPLARQHRATAGLAETWDLIVGGVELAMANSELVDPVRQRESLQEQALLVAAGDPEAMQLDEDFLRALEFGMPPTGGMGMGIDRLLRLLTGTGIRETILFPLLRPEA